MIDYRTQPFRLLLLIALAAALLGLPGEAFAVDENAVQFLVMDAEGNTLAKIGVIEGEMGTLILEGTENAIGFSPRLMDAAGNMIEISIYDVTNPGGDNEQREHIADVELTAGAVASVGAPRSVDSLKIKVLNVHLGSS